MQKLGKSLVLPVAVRPVAGVKAACNAADAVGDPVAAHVVWHPLYIFLQVLQGSGNPIFGALPLIFTIGVALGMPRNDGVSALAARR